MILRYLANDKIIQTYPVILPILRSSPPNKLNCMTAHDTACHMFVNSRFVVSKILLNRNEVRISNTTYLLNNVIFMHFGAEELRNMQGVILKENQD